MFASNAAPPAAPRARSLVLWDIDGTLMSCGGAGERALRRALLAVQGSDRGVEGIDYSGRTDRFIARAMLERERSEVTEDSLGRLLAAYVEALRDELPRGAARPLPGVPEAVAALAAEGDVLLGLLTGNLRAGAAAKLAHVGLADPFTFGAFSDDAEHRNDLGPHALHRAAQARGRAFDPAREVWVVGDTPRDIECARAVGARVVAVAQGRFSAAELDQAGADAVFPDFSDWRGLIQVLRG